MDYAWGANGLDAIITQVQKVPLVSNHNLFYKKVNDTVLAEQLSGCIKFHLTEITHENRINQ